MAEPAKFSRRKFMTTAAAVAGSALAPKFALRAPLQYATVDTPKTNEKAASREKVPWKVRPFPMKQVLLGEGACKVAMEADRQYLRSLPSERLLHTFRVNGGRTRRNAFEE